MSELTKNLREEFKDKETRRIYVDDFLNTFIATQIKVLREQQGLTQAALAEAAGMRQERISVLEDVDYSSWTISVLNRLAEAFDLRLSVKFESFGSFLNEFETFERKALERPSFDEDPAFKGTESVNPTTASEEDRVVTATPTQLEDIVNKAVQSAVTDALNSLSIVQSISSDYQEKKVLGATKPDTVTVMPQIDYLNQNVS